MTTHVISKHASLGGVAVVAAAALMLAGCAGPAPGPAASPESTQSAAASASPSPMPTLTAAPAYKPASASGPAQNVPVPVLPAVAKTKTKEGLEAFTKYWYQLLDYGYQTGDTRPLAGASAPGCRFCAGLREGIEEAWGEGRWVVGGKIETPAITARLAPGQDAYSVVQVIQQDVEIRRPDGTLYQDPTPSTNSGSRASATFGPDGWAMDEIGFIG
ncbi:DUF6318 family protein [Pseudarthrobacter sp. NPDC092401]|uniref:DUF6318 family protein n=2 Tax=unclassified Pseudarthrobacter TaxID=2647000 RepID=UPI00382C243D